MKNYNIATPQILKFRKGILLGLVALGVNSIYAQSSITALRFNGQNVKTVKLNVMPPGKGGNLSEAKVGDQLASGTKLIIPANTMVMLQSPGGQQKLSSTTGKPMEYTVEITAKGENHAAQGVGAQIENTVNKTVGYNYRVNNGKGTTAASKGTVFTFTDLSQPGNEKATITTQEGRINIIDEVPVTINGQQGKENKRGEKLTKSISKFQSQGEDQFTSTNQPVNYGNYDEAISAISTEVQGESDPDERADDLCCLGELYMDDEQPQQAVKPFSEAVKIYLENYGDDDMNTLEAKLSLADALMSSSQEQKAQSILTEVINILEDNLSIDLEDLNYVKGENDEEAEQIICVDIIEEYGMLGWAYEIKGDETQSNDYYNKMEHGCQ